MRRLFNFSGVVFLASAMCCGQSGFTIPLASANSALALPSMAVRDSVVYVAYRSFDFLHFSRSRSGLFVVIVTKK